MSQDMPIGFEVSRCPLGCQHGDERVLIGKDRILGNPGRFQIVRCLHCGLMRTSPRPSKAIIADFYHDNYGPYQKTEPPARKGGWRRAISRWLYQDPRRIPPMPPGKLLEIGCAHGAWLETMARSGWECDGVELSSKAARDARDRGLDVQEGLIEDVTPRLRQYDAIAAWMVLEHLHDPIAALSQLATWAKADGWLILSVPDAKWEISLYGSRGFALQLPHHMFHFTATTLAKVLKAGGWSLRRIHWQHNERNFLLSLANHFSDSHYPRTAAFIRGVADGRNLRPVRALLAGLLGATRLSGRMTVWARRT